MILWFEIPALLELQTDEVLWQAREICETQVVRFSRGPQYQLDDAVRMRRLIEEERRLRRDRLERKKSR
jgi:hypothetical protein